MSYVSLKKKAMVAFMCLLSFTMGCILTTQLNTRNVIGREGGYLSLQQHLNKGLRRQDTRPERRNVTVPQDLPSEEDLDLYDESKAIIGENLTIVNEHDYGIKNTVVKSLQVTLQPPVIKPASKYQYLVKVRDPRAEMILQKVISKLPDDLYRSVAVKNNLVKSKVVKNPRWPPMTAQKKWSVFIDSMESLGYEQRLPTIINIGVKKSGTNAFGFFISQHPQIVHSIGNEVHYFDWNYDKGIEYYRSRMGFSKADQLSFEKTPRYFVTPDAPLHVLKDLPENVKFILCVRDPVERARSEFRHEAELKMRRGRQDKTAVKAEAAQETSATQGKIFQNLVLDASGQVNASNDIVKTSIYSKHFSNWLTVFPRDRFYILSDELVNKDIYSEMKNIERFLGLKPFYKKSMFYYNTEIHAPCMYVKPRPCPAKSTPGFLPKAEPSPAIIQKLREFYRPYNQEFEKLAQMKFSWTNL